MYEWFILGPLLLLGIVIPLARSARWRTLALATIVCGVLLAATTFMPWKTVVALSSPRGDLASQGTVSWRVDRRTETGLSYSWRGSLILVLGLGLGVASWWIGSRPRDDSLVRATGAAAFVVAASFATVAAVALDRYSVLAPDTTDSRLAGREEQNGGLTLAAMASVACVTFSVALLLKLSKERVRRRGGSGLDAATLRQVFR